MTKVLIVDDEMDFGSILAERLELRGFKATAAASASEAVAEIRGSGSPDVVLLDLKMPGLDGIETLGLIKGIDPTIEVIMLTGHGSTGSAIEGMNRGLFDYLMKPADIGEITEKIRQAAEKRAGK